MIYEEIPEMTKVEIEAAIKQDYPSEVLLSALSAVLYSSDLTWAQSICSKLSTHENNIVRGNAILGFGHLARIYGELNKEIVIPLIQDALHDSDKFVRGHTESAADDIGTYLGWII